ncbi:hypothetical protein HaLaN_16853 [Haematococcus lacustris]|uniref:Uncharacterized protein n=1 Tax=Haematococcus lacustris TaxID=44745 RepID=A0A699ZB33_HAELA|nr:hypothetical protein HaLaN_16853 [Haematococcus lacustris]
MLHGKLEEDMAGVSMERHGHAKPLVVFFGTAGIGTAGGSAVNGQQQCERQLNECRATRPVDWKPPAGQVEQRLAPRSSQAATQPAASEPGPSTPPPAKRSKRTKAEPAAEPTQPTKGKGKAAKAKA